MKRYILIAAMFSSFAMPCYAELNEGIAAAAAGNYAQAASEFEPLAAAGDPAAQYYLAKLYLEGHGPSNDVQRGVALMTQAAKSNHPEAQAQLGLMYAMGLGVKVDNAQAHDWLTKAIAALPEGTRRAVAEANRDAVVQRMTQQQRVAAGTPTAPAAVAPVVAAATPAPVPEPAPAAQPAATESAAVPATPAPAEPKQPAAAAQPATPAIEPTATETAATVTPSTPTAPTQPAKAEQPAANAAETTPTEAAEAAAPASQPAAEPKKPAANAAAANAPEPVASAPEQIASAEAPEAPAAPATQAGAEQVKSGVRVQVASLPSEDAAWQEWKRISQEMSSQVSGLTAVVETADLGQQGIFYRLQAGPFESFAAAKDRCEKMKEAGLDCIVVGKQ